MTMTTLPRQELDETAMTAPRARSSSTAVAASGAAVTRSLSTETAAVADADGALRSSGVAVASDGNASRIRTVSPTTTNHADDDADFLSAYLCPFLINKPPVEGAYFDVAGADGELSQQVFEYSRLYRYIATLGTGRSFHPIRHPLNGGLVGRQEALLFVRRASPELQAVFDQERLRRGLTLDDDEPIGPSDNALFNETMRQVRDT